MRIVYYQRDYPAPEDYGRDYAEIAAGLAALGNDVTVLTPHRTVKETLWRGTRIIDCPSGWSLFTHASRVLKNASGAYPPNHQFDVMFVQEWWSLSSHALARTATRANLPVLFAPWASLNPYAIGRDARGFQKKVICRLIALWYGKTPPILSLYDKRDAEFAAMLGIHWSWILGALPVYSYSKHSTAFDWHSILKRDVSGRRILLFNARLDIWQKGFDLLLNGFKLAMQKRGQKFRTLLVLSGRAPEGILAGDGRLAEEMANKLCETGFGIWLGCVSIEDRANMLAHCDMFVYPSRVDGPPRPLREALWRHTPVMVTHETGMASWVEQYQAGLTIRVPDAEAVCDAVVEFDRMSSDTLAEMRLNAARLAERLAPGPIALDYENALKQTICLQKGNNCSG